MRNGKVWLACKACAELADVATRAKRQILLRLTNGRDPRIRFVKKTQEEERGA